eukprot:6174770-Pleurochrysis_carterae.AAC.3
MRKTQSKTVTIHVATLAASRAFRFKDGQVMEEIDLAKYCDELCAEACWYAHCRPSEETRGQKGLRRAYLATSAVQTMCSAAKRGRSRLDGTDDGAGASGPRGATRFRIGRDRRRSPRVHPCVLARAFTKELLRVVHTRSPAHASDEMLVVV